MEIIQLLLFFFGAICVAWTSRTFGRIAKALERVADAHEQSITLDFPQKNERSFCFFVDTHNFSRVWVSRISSNYAVGVPD
jgi:hypothetical protein